MYDAAALLFAHELVHLCNKNPCSKGEHERRAKMGEVRVARGMGLPIYPYTEETLQGGIDLAIFHATLKRCGIGVIIDGDQRINSDLLRVSGTVGV